MKTTLFKWRLLESASSDSGTVPVGRLVQNLVLSAQGIDWDISSEREYVNALICILSHTPFLRSYSVLGQYWNTEVGELACLSAMCATTLTSLDISIRESRDDIFLIINCLAMLQDLHIQIEPDDHESPWLSRPLKLHRVTYLTWLHESCDLAMLDYLAACQFAPHCTVHLGIPDLKESTAFRLLPFFQQNQVQELILDAHPCVQKQPEFARAIMKLPQLDILAGIVYPQLLQAGTLPDVMTFDFPDDEADDEVKSLFWDFLHKMLDVGTYMVNGLGSKSVNIRYSGGLFSWDTRNAAPNYAEFVGKLLPFAGKLYQKGILVMDGNRHDVTVLACWPY
jgi:hypothetical protein